MDMRIHPNLGPSGARTVLAVWNMDMFARLSVLEGAAGVTPGSWVRKAARGMGAALNSFGAGLHPDWTSVRDMQVYRGAVASARRAMTGVSGHDPEELIQELNVHAADPSGPKRRRLFYSVGEALNKHNTDLSKGLVGPTHSLIGGTISRWVTNAARDLIASWKEKQMESFAPGGQWDPLRGKGTPQLSQDNRDKLLLLAFQSPGEPGRKLRSVIDREIDRYFRRPGASSIVKSFLKQIANPRYRSVADMKRLMSRFDPSRWFTQAFNLARKEVMAETGATSQQVTLALGSKATKVFKFLREHIGRNSAVKKIIEDLGNEIDILEAGMGPRLAKEHKQEEHEEEDVEAAQDKESELTPDQTPVAPHSSVFDWARSGKDYHTWRDQHTRDTGGYLHLASRIAGRWVEKVAGLDGSLEDRIAKTWAARQTKDS